MFREITEIYGAIWEIGRAQIFGKQEDPLEFPVRFSPMPTDGIRLRFLLFG